MKKTITVMLLAVLVLSLCIPALGAINTLEVPITYRGIKIVLNGQELSPTDERGNSTEPFIMDDSTYLPARAIAEALGLDVEWDDSRSTVYLSSAGNIGSESGSKQVVSMIPDTTIQGPLGYVIATNNCSIFPYTENAYFSPESFCMNHLLRVDRRFLVETADGESEYWLLVSAYDGGQISDGQFYPAMRMEQVWIKEMDVIPYTEETKSQLAYPVWVVEHANNLSGGEVDSEESYTIGEVKDGSVYISAPGGTEHWIAADNIIYPDLTVYSYSYLN